MAKSTEKMTVKWGLGTLPRKMTKRQAIRYAEKRISNADKKAGFKVEIFTAKIWLNGWEGYRINIVKEWG